MLLCEKGDLAEGASSRSGKLVHGGRCYREYYEFRLVREALIKREMLLNAAPHIIWPMRLCCRIRPGSTRHGLSASEGGHGLITLWPRPASAICQPPEHFACRPHHALLQHRVSQGRQSGGKTR